MEFVTNSLQGTTLGPTLGSPVVLDSDENSITIVWKKENKDVLSYEIQMAECGEEEGTIDDNINWTTLSSSFKGNKVKKKNLEPGKAYTFRYRSRDRLGWNLFSPSSKPSWTLQSGQNRLENGPQIHAVETGAVMLGWQCVEGASSYELQISDAAYPVWQTVSTNIQHPAVKKKGLDANTKYIFRVRPLFAHEDSASWAFSPPSSEISPPILSQLLSSMLPVNLINNQNQAVSQGALAGKVVAIYFSAHWCGPCRKFTPQLATFYNQMKAARRPFEVVFVSCDGDAGSMMSYFSEMPWLAVPFDDDKREQIQSDYQVSGIPRLMVVGPGGAIVAENAVGMPLSEQLVTHWASGGTTAAPQKAAPPPAGGCCGGGKCG
mmetsp:Transcript_36956/g.57691  ORF Transcript_36956/g.57691 Transcript_36956/m.57691 type:complete len:377 (+) Transcript_36956:20-1150(+)